MNETREREASQEPSALRARICRGRALWVRFVAMVFVCCLVAMCMNIQTSSGSEERDPYLGFVDGTVTAIRDKSISINERPYAIKIGVAVTDQYGQPVEYRMIEAGDRIKYLVQDGMIVKIIVIQPS